MEESDTGITRLRRIAAQLSGDDGGGFVNAWSSIKREPGMDCGSTYVWVSFLGAGAPHGGKVSPAPNGTRSFAVLRQSTAPECE